MITITLFTSVIVISSKSKHKMSKVLAAGLVVYRSKGGSWEYLLLQATFKNHWTPPKGHVDPGEDLLTTAYRETEEEAGISKSQLRLTDFKMVLNYPVKNKPKEVTYWLAEYIGDKEDPVVLSNEHKAFRWSTLEHALQYVDHDNTKDLLSKSQEYLSSQI